MSYLRDPNTRRLATNCIMCGRALRDARSVETGIGPVCRGNLGYDDMMSGFSEARRKKANKLIHSSGIAMDADDLDTILENADKLQRMKLPVIADKIRHRFIPIRLERAENVQVYGWSRGSGSYAIEGKTRNVIKVFTPARSGFNDARKSMRIRMRPVKEGKVFYWEAGEEQGQEVMALLKRCFPGRKALGDKGIFVIPEERDDNRRRA